jgi:hypothetical protein
LSAVQRSRKPRVYCSPLLIQSLATAMSGHRAHSYHFASLCFQFPLVQECYSPGRYIFLTHVFLRKKTPGFRGAQGRAGCVFEARISLDNLTENWTYISYTRSTYVYKKVGGKYHLPTRDEKKKVKKKKRLKIFRRTSWETLAWRTNW